MPVRRPICKRRLRAEIHRAGVRRLRLEPLEPRLALTWAGVPLVAISPPSTATAITLDAQGDATGTASIVTTEVDYYKFSPTNNGSHVFSAVTPGSSLDTVVGVFSATGQRLAFNDDISRADTDSRLSVNLTAGATYYVGITNYSVRSRGTYNWIIDGPASAPVTTPQQPVVSFPDVAYYGGQTEWNLNAINAPESWAQGYEGQGVVVAVVEKKTHTPDL